MKIEFVPDAAAQRPDPRGSGGAQPSGSQDTSPGRSAEAFETRLSEAARQALHGGDGESRPGNSANSPAHQARRAIAEGLVASGEGTEFSSQPFGQVVSRIAQGYDYFAPAETTDRAPEAGEPPVFTETPNVAEGEAVAEPEGDAAVPEDAFAVLGGGEPEDGADASETDTFGPVEPVTLVDTDGLTDGPLERLAGDSSEERA
ncbi:MAG: hypothetical protein ACE5KF_00455 [Kiloniellaceae bacterium]